MSARQSMTSKNLLLTKPESVKNGTKFCCCGSWCCISTQVTCTGSASRILSAEPDPGYQIPAAPAAIRNAVDRLMRMSAPEVYRQRFDSVVTSQGVSGMHTNEQGSNVKRAEKLRECLQYGGDCFSSESSGTTCKALFRMLAYALLTHRESCAMPESCQQAPNVHWPCVRQVSRPCRMHV